jgi:2-polyprenyl-3-methyl-5-hydroxy-6-metoxy-1,4-benzoquinol methylase
MTLDLPDSNENLAQTFINKGDPTGWFEVLYAEANWDETAIPWESGQPHPTFQTWLTQRNFKADPPGQKALVVACGLGHDAEKLARLGFAVTAFDISPTAIAWCHRRFPHSSVNYHVADLFDPPLQWLAGFDFVLDIYTIQALPPFMHEQTVAAIAGLVRPGGRLLASYLGREDERLLSYGPPWPLAKFELDWFQQHGLTELAFEDYEEMVGEFCVRRFRAEYQKLA